MTKEGTKLPAYFTIGKVISYAMYIWVVFGIVVLALRVFLLAFSANVTAPFVNFIYTTSESFLNPFRGIFPLKPIGETGYLDVAALFAIIIYALIGWGFRALIELIQAKSSQYIRHEQLEREYAERHSEHARPSVGHAASTKSASLV